MDPLTLIGGAALGAGGLWAARRLAEGGGPKEGLGDLLQWAFLIDDGVILMKDGAFLSGFRVRGRDLESAAAQELNRAAAAVGEVLGLLSEGWALEVNMHRRGVCGYPLREKSHFPTDALWALEEERRTQFETSGEHFTTDNTVLVTYAPPKDIVRKWERLVVSGVSAKIDYAELLHRYRRTCEEIEALLEGACHTERMSSAELLSECHRCLTGHDHEAYAPPHSYLSWALASCDLASGFQPVVGADHVFAVAVTSLGHETAAAAGDFFNRIRDTARWHVRFVGLSRHETARRIRKLQTRWFHGRGGLRAIFSPEERGNEEFEDRDAARMQSETADALADSASGRARFGYFTNTFFVRDEDRRRGAARARALMQTLRDQGFGCALETYNATDAFIGSLPGHGAANLRRPLVSSRNVAHLFPTTTPWPGEAVCPSSLFPKNSPPLFHARGRGATPFRVNLHQGDVGHTLVVGATGAGKSVLAAFMALSFLRYEKSRVFVFDVGRSHLVPTLAAGGAHRDLASGQALQPLRRLSEVDERLWALDWLETVWELAGRKAGPAERRELGRALALLAHAEPEERTLTALYVSLPARMQEVLEPYTVKGPYGRLLDGSSAPADVERIQCWELSDVLSLGDALAAPLLLTLFRQVERSLCGAPTLIVVEEAWAALLRSAFARRLQEWLLTLRKRNAALVVVAHSAAQIRALDNPAILTESCPTRILLPNPEAAGPDNAPVYRTLGLGAREIEIVASAQRRRDYYYSGPDGSRLFELNLGPVARALLLPTPGMSVEESTLRKRELIARSPSAFLDHLTP